MVVSVIRGQEVVGTEAVLKVVTAVHLHLPRVLVRLIRIMW